MSGRPYITISKQFYLNCAHSLPHLPEGHKCRNLHGHTYGVTLFCSGYMEGDWLIDYADIQKAWEPIFALIDHRNLDEILPLATTAENLAMWIADELAGSLPSLSAVHVQETENTNVIFGVRPRELLARVMRP